MVKESLPKIFLLKIKIYYNNTYIKKMLCYFLTNIVKILVNNFF